MTSFISKVFSGAKNTLFHPIESIQSASQTCGVLIKKTKEVFKATISGAACEVYGYDINLVTRLRSNTLLGPTTNKVLSKIDLNPVLEAISDTAIREQMGEIHQVIDQKFQQIISPITNSNIQSFAANNTVTENPSISELKISKAETEVRTSLVNHIINFSSITWFDTKILGAKRNDSMEFYRSLVAENQGQALNAYYELLWQQSAFYYSMASVLIPISSWFIGLFINPPEGVDGGITHAKKVLTNYFNDHENSRTELKELIKTSKTYFYKLYTMYESFISIKKDSSNPEHNLTLEEYLNKKLKEDIIENDRSPDVLCKKFNKVLVELFIPRTGVPFVGGFIDSVLKQILSLVIDSMDPINKLLSSSFAQSQANTTFTYKVTSLIEETVKKLHEELIASQSLKKTSNAAPKEEIAISEEERTLVKDFVANLLKFLPLEGSTENQVEESIKDSSSFINKPLDRLQEITIRSKAKSEIKNTLQNFGVDLFEMFISPRSNQEQNLKMWVQILKIADDFFSQPAVPRTTSDCILIKQQTKNAFKDLLNTALESHFRNSLIDVRKTLSQNILQNLHADINDFGLRMHDMKKLLDKAIEVKNISLVIELKNEMLIQIKNFFTKCQLSLEETLSSDQITLYTKNTVKSVLTCLSQKIHELLEKHSQIEVIIDQLKLNSPLQNAILNLFPNGSEDQNQTSTILPKKTLEELLKSLNMIASSQKAFVDEKDKINIKHIASSFIEIDKISEINQSLLSKASISKILDEAKQIATQNAIIKEAFNNRPKDENIEYFKGLIYSLRKATQYLYNHNEVSTDDIEYVQELFRELDEAMQEFAFDQTSLSQLRNFLQTPDQTAIKDGYVSISIAFKNLEAKLISGPIEDKKAISVIGKNNLKLQMLQQHILVENQNFVFENSKREASLERIEVLIEQNLVETLLLTGEKSEHQTALLKAFDEMLRQKEVHIDSSWLQARTLCMDLDASFKKIVASGMDLKEQEILFSVNWGKQQKVDFQKNMAKPIFESITDKLLDVALEPRHRQQLLFRSAIASQGSFYRIMRSQNL